MTSPAAAPTTPPARPGMVRRLYDWVIGWADTRFAVPALILLAFAESSFFPIPPDVLLIAMCIGSVPQSYRFAFWCSVGSVLGGVAGYAIGAFLWDVAWVHDFFVMVAGQANIDRVSQLYESWNFWIVFAAAFTPLPYKVITITAGIFGISFPMFLLASAVGRPARFFLVAWLFKHFGPGIKDFIEKRFALVTIVGAAVLVGGFLAIKLLIPSQH